jgi:flagellar hook protein FlgE
MGLNTFSTALSGLSTNTEGLNVVGNNLANMNTVGYKTSKINFTDILGQAVAGVGSGGNNSVGLGAQVSNVTPVFSQGGFESTNNPTDVAIQGKGFFIVNDGQGQFYTRAGNFRVNADGNLVNPSGHKVQGFARNPNTGAIDSTGALVDIQIPATTGFSNATSNIELAFNLDSSAPVGAKFATSVQLYDSVGSPHLATIDFVKSAVAGGETRWSFDITVPRNSFEGVLATNTEKFSLISGAVASATPDQGSLIFDNAGKMKSVYVGAAPGVLPPPGDLALPPAGVTFPNLNNGGALLPNGLNWKFVSDNGDLNASGLASASSVTFNNQDGVPPGQMTSLAIQADGTISGIFSNGLTQDVARLALGQFRNESGMISRGGGLFVGSNASGALLLGVPGEGGSGRLVGGSLELSNVDLASEFTKIITYQRGYQASARIISATDQILQETINLRN